MRLAKIAACQRSRGLSLRVEREAGTIGHQTEWFQVILAKCALPTQPDALCSLHVEMMREARGRR